MTRKYLELRSCISLQSREWADPRASAILRGMRCHELRHARSLTRKSLMDKFNCRRGDISKIEKQVDMYIATLREQIELMGGVLDVVATFSADDFSICNFSDVD